MTKATNVNAFFDDLDASSVISLATQQIAAPLVSGTPITADELMMGGGIRIAYHIIDRSPSMEPVAQMFLDGMSKDYVPAIQEAREDDISVLRIGGLSFSTDITPMWQKGGNYFHTLEELPSLTRADYDPSKGWGTALHKAIIQGNAMAMKHAQEVLQQTGIQPEVDIIVLTDGGNNDAPHDPDEVKKIVTGTNRGLVRYVFFYFDTDDGMKDPRKYAIEKLGFDPENVQVFALNPGESATDRHKRFRRMLRVMSKVSASKATSAVKAAAVVQQTAASTDEDVV